MQKVIIFLLLSFFLSANAQDFNPKILELPENLKVDDFSFLKEELKDVQVVMLGEINHFDGNVFELKTKVAKYLYKEMGFKTMAFESGIYDVWKAQKDINNGVETKKAFIKSLFTIWAKKNEFQSFIEFYDQNKTDLKLFGFDNQISGQYGEEELAKDLYAYCKKNDFKFKLNYDDFSLLLESICRGFFDEEDISYKEYTSTLTALLNNISYKDQTEEHFYWSQIIKSLLALAKDQYLDIDADMQSTFSSGINDNIRDEQMANNLLAYVKKHPNEKIICWAANTHIVNSMSSISTSGLKEFTPMGSYIKTVLKDKVYSLATVTAADSIYLGNPFVGKKWYKTPVDKASFEYYLKKQNKPFVFISANQPEMKKKQLNRLFSPITFVEARLDLLHDGYVYLNEPKLTTAIPLYDTDYKGFNASPSISKQIVPLIDEISNQKNDTIGTGVALNEIVIYSKKTAYQIVKKAIKVLNKNYPVKPVSSKLYTNLTTKIKDTVALNVDFTANQYEKSYLSIVTSSKQLKEIRWNIENGYEPQSLREFYSFMFNNPIRSGGSLKSKKFSKFKFFLEEIKKYDDKEVYVIHFSCPRDHFTYTGRKFLSNYTGTLFINKEDYAFVKVKENWEVTDLPEFQRLPLNLVGDFANFNDRREWTNEHIETFFTKIKDRYFISHSVINITGKVFDVDNNSLPYTTRINSYWYDFNVDNPEKIKYKEDNYLFEKIDYDKAFWANYTIPILQ